MALRDVLLLNAAVVGALMTLTWLISLPIRNTGIVDIVWGFGFCVVAVTTRASADGVAGRQNLLTGLTVLWGLRLAGYLAWRNIGKPEDYRYAAMRRRAGARWPVQSLVTVFALQGLLLFVVALPIQLAQTTKSPSPGWLAGVGAALWLVGFIFESVGDFQLARFKGDPANAGRVMDRGLWRYTRHPNYFGDAVAHWGLFLVALSTPHGWLTALSPALMTFLLLRVSGVALLERSIGKRRPEYAEYQRRTSAFFPLPPKP